MIDGIQPQVVDLQGGEGFISHLLGDDTASPHLGEVPYPAEHSVGDAGGSTAAARDLHGPVGFNGHLQDAGGSGNDQRQFRRGIEFKP